MNTQNTTAAVAFLPISYDTPINFFGLEAGTKIKAIEQPTANNITRPVPNTKTGLVWAICDSIYSMRKAQNDAEPDTSKHILPVPVVSEVIDIYEKFVDDAKGPTARQQFGFWLKFYGLESMRDARVLAEGSAEEEAKKAAKAEKERIKAEKEAEKERIKAEKEAKEIERLAANEDKLNAELKKAEERQAKLKEQQAKIIAARQQAAKAAKEKALADAKAAKA